MVVELGLDGQRLLMEIPDLGASSIWCLDYHVPVVDEIEISVSCKLGDNVEWSFNIESEIFVQLSLSRFSFPFISVDDIPLLVDLSMFVPDNDVSLLSINSAMYIHNLSFLIYDESSIKSEELPPS